MVDPHEVVDANLHCKEKDREGFERFANALQAAVFALDLPIISMSCLASSLVCS